jgi:hypothetical protein
MVVVPRLTTPLPLELIPDLIEGAFHVLGTRLTPAQKVNLTSLVAVETDRGKSIQNGNLGNISAGPSYTGRVWRPPWFEVDDSSPPSMLALNKKMLDGKAPSAFRAYESIQVGAVDFARLLLSPPYAPLLRAADGNDVDAFRRELARRYSPDYENAAVTRTLEKLRAELGAASPGAGGALALVVFLLSVAWFGRSKPRRRRRR